MKRIPQPTPRAPVNGWTPVDIKANLYLACDLCFKRTSTMFYKYERLPTENIGRTIARCEQCVGVSSL